MQKRVDDGNYYITQEMVWADLKRMMENCKTFNEKPHPYFHLAERLEQRYLNRWVPTPL